MDTQYSTQILVVEDNSDDSFILSRLITRAQIDDHVTVVASGEEAFDFLKTVTPVALFLDLHLPGMRGTEFLEKLRENPKFATLPVIIMTGSLDPKDVETCSRFGVSAYLPKPVSLSDFIKSVALVFPQAAAS